MQPTKTLSHEHQVILLVLDAAEREARHIQSNNTVHADKVEKMVDFFRTFADRCHHAKEEKLLFEKMYQRGMPRHTGPIAVMLQEHDQGRAHVRAMAEVLPGASGGDPAALTRLRENLLGYAQLLRAHIQKEDNILYPMADDILLPADQEDLAKAFERVEAEEIGPGIHEKYHQLAHELAES